MDAAGLRIAIADDDRSSREVLHRLLTGLGHQVVAVADTGLGLVEQCARTQPDLVITDNLMPGLSGTEAATLIFQQHPTQIILLSAFSDRELVLAAEQKPLLMYLVKPVSEQILKTVLSRCMQLRGEQESASSQNDRVGPSDSNSLRISAPMIRHAALPPYDQDCCKRTAYRDTQSVIKRRF